MRNPILLRGQICEERFPEGSVCTIGNFDGIHRGHQRILAALHDAARRLSIPHSVVVTFSPHPAVVLGRVQQVRMLSSIRQRLALFAGAGVTAVRSIWFSERVATLSAEQFFAAALIQELGCRHLVLGPDTALGKGREGTLDRLQEIAARYRCSTEVVPCEEHGGKKISSGVIRQLIQSGRIVEGTELLGRPYSVQSRVVHGDKRGRQIGFPTINLSLRGRVIPSYGVYACFASIRGVVMPAVANVGVRPTFGHNAPVLEAHLMGYQDGDLYGQLVELHFVERIRDEVAFNGVESLKQQIALDCSSAMSFLASDRGSYWHRRLQDRAMVSLS